MIPVEEQSPIEDLSTLALKLTKQFTEDGSLLKCQGILRAYTGTDYKKYCHFSTERYHRVKLEDVCNEHLEFFLLCWEGEQRAPPHDHPKTGCALKLLEGSLTETLYARPHNSLADEPSYVNCGSRILKAGDVSYMQDHGCIHSIANGTQRSISLHVYEMNYQPVFYSVAEDQEL